MADNPIYNILTVILMFFLKLSGGHYNKKLLILIALPPEKIKNENNLLIKTLNFRRNNPPGIESPQMAQRVNRAQHMYMLLLILTLYFRKYHIISGEKEVKYCNVFFGRSFFGRRKLSYTFNST